jgi:hypothetical protein
MNALLTLVCIEEEAGEVLNKKLGGLSIVGNIKPQRGSIIAKYSFVLWQCTDAMEKKKTNQRTMIATQSNRIHDWRTDLWIRNGKKTNQWTMIARSPIGPIAYVKDNRK